jgi:hypothetical protein
VYGHHPPGVALVLAAVFQLSGSDSPATARTAAIVFHLASLALLLRLVRRLDPGPLPFAVMSIVAVLPMSAYFGRMVNYEAFCLPFVLLQLDGYAAARAGELRVGLARVGAGIFLGGLFDWPAFFFGVVLTISLFLDAFSSPRLPRWAFAVPAAAGLLGFTLDVAHLALAGGGSLGPLAEVLSGPGQGTFPPQDIAMGILETCRRYLSHAGLLCGLVALAALPLPVGRRLLDGSDPALARRLLAVSGAGWLGYAVAAPSWAKVHPYWQFYLLPFTALSLLVCIRALRRSASAPGRWAALSRALLAALAVETLATSGYVLWLRHTRVSGFAVEKTRELRSAFLSPVPP